MRGPFVNGHQHCARRRGFLTSAAALGAGVLLPGSAHGAEIRDLRGTVFVNRRVATFDTPIRPGDSVVAAWGSSITFVLGGDAFRVRGGTALTIDPDDGALARGLRILTGALLGVFGRGSAVLGIRNATIGIRGTGLYLDVSPTRTYFCTCYGETNLWAEGAPHHISATHHNAQYIDFDESGTMTMQATQVIGHDDAELRELEAFHGRRPPFDA